VFTHLGSAYSPVTIPVFKTGGRHLAMSPVGSTPTRFRHLVSMSYAVCRSYLELRRGVKIGVL